MEGWKRGDMAPNPPAPTNVFKPGVYHVGKDIPQGKVRIGRRSIQRDDPDFYSAEVMNEILGGDRFGSRLMAELRENRGLTYGARASLSVFDQAEIISGSFSTGADTAGQAVEVLRETWAKMAAEGVSDEELNLAKRYLTGSYPLRFDGNGAIAGIMVGMQVLGLSPDYPKTRNALVEAVTAQDVARVAARLLDPGKLFVMVVGQDTGLVGTE